MKPNWMKADDWAAFVRTHTKADGMRCASCGTDEDITIDHILPRVRGGSDEVSNLQPMCRKCNSHKGTRPDTYWGKQFYFDLPLNRSALRVSQDNFVFSLMEEHAEFFARPFSSINHKLFLFAQIVGAGKTLGLFILPFALNQAIGRDKPRVDRMLVVTKDTPLRSQIVHELRTEPATFGVIGNEPSVLEVSRFSDLVQPEPHDIAVMCPNMLWPNKDGTGVKINEDLRVDDVDNVFVNWREHMDMVLDRYPIIVFDETHYAHENISKLVRTATNNLIFGFTASPVKASGELLADMVLMSVYGYEQAAIHDKSMKSLQQEGDMK